jgi:replication-associated recombination protein RarA
MDRELSAAHREQDAQVIDELPLADEARPLADRMRPQSLADYVGQTHLLGPGKPLRRMAATCTR